MKKITTAFISICLIGCSAADSNTYTLYRSSAVGASMRIHVATFNADEIEDYNRENCEAAQQLFQKQKGVTVNFWCEKGAYRK